MAKTTRTEDIERFHRWSRTYERSWLQRPEWPTVLRRVEQGEPLRKIAAEYTVSYETIRRVVRAALEALIESSR